MVASPSLVELCKQAVVALVKQDAETRKELLTLPMDLLQNIIPLLPPFALELVHDEAGYTPWFMDRWGESHSGQPRGSKRSFDAMVHGSSSCCLNDAWKQHFDRRWPSGVNKHRFNAALSPSKVELLNLCEDEATIDWRQCFWEAHLQECLNEAVAQASTSPLEGPLGEITLSNHLLQKIGYELPSNDHRDLLSEVSSICSLKYNCWHFGQHARYLRLRGALCTKELSNLLSSCIKLRHIVFYHIATTRQVEGLCLILSQHKESLQVLEFQRCRFFQAGVSNILNSLVVNGGDSHLLQHLFVLSSSTMFQDNTASSQFMRFLHAGRYLRSLVLIDNQLSHLTTTKLFSTISNAVPHLTLFCLSDNELEGFSAPSSQNTLQKSTLASLKALDLRSNKLSMRDIKEFLPYFNLMPLLERIDLSDNPISDEGVRALAPMLRAIPLFELSVSACNISMNAACFLFDLLVSLKRPLRSLKISHNPLGRFMAIPLANFLRHGVVERLDIGDIGLGSNGCVELQDALQEIPSLIHLVIKKNRIGSAGAALLCKLISGSNTLKVIDFSSNLLDSQCLLSIASHLQGLSAVDEGKLELVDLRYNLAEDSGFFKHIKKPTVLLSEVGNFYDDDP